MYRKLLLMVALMLSVKTFAANYGMAGCGLGALAFKDEPGKIQIVAATLNNIFSPQTSAITSGTSNCYEEGGSAMNVKYIETNKVALKEDVSRGQGETLAGLITLMGCQNDSAVKSELKTNFQSIFQNENPESILNSIQSVESVKKYCKHIG